MPDKLTKKICPICGTVFYVDRDHHASIYDSDECRKIAWSQPKEKRVDIEAIDKAKEIERHQKDPSVWCRDYGEKQKAKTLAMIGKINTSEILDYCKDCAYDLECAFKGMINGCQFKEKKK